MMLKNFCCSQLIAIGIFSAVGWVGRGAMAQVVPDGTLGAESSRLTPNVVIGGARGDRIDGGAQRAGNLFHSFSDFNIGAGQRLYFANPAGIQTIFTRVTGSAISSINGTLGVDGAASLFLLNPNGILFGQTARLDLGGSFVGTTANLIRFGDRGTFSATNPQAVPLLTIQPSALVFTQINSGKIVSESIVPAGQSSTGRNLLGLRVPDGQSLLLVGGDIEIDGKGKDGGLNAQEGRIELGGLNSAGEIALDPQFRLTFSNDAVRSNIALTNTARVNVRGNGGGDIAINSETITAEGGGRLVAGTEGSGNAGTITVSANILNLSAKGFELGAASTFVLSNQVLGDATGNGGSIIIDANNLFLKSNAIIITGTFGKGNGGDIIIDAREKIVINEGYIASSALKNSTGTSGKIRLTTGSLSLLNGSQVNSTTSERGNAGDIQITARDQVLIDGFRTDSKIVSNITSTVNKSGQGNSGNIYVSTGSLVVSNGGTIKATSEGKGNAGTIRIAARDYISLDGTQRNNVNGGLYSQAAYSKGRSGNIEIDARSLSLANGAQIDVASFNSDRVVNDTGDITIRVQDKLSIDGANDYVSSRIRNEINSLGKGGNIDIQTGSLILTNGGLIDSSTRDEALAGNIKIQARDIIRIEGQDLGGTYSERSGIYSTVERFAVGQGGNINITTGSLFLSDRGVIAAFTEGRGNAGNITIQARDTIAIDGRNNGNSYVGGIYSTVENTAKGKGGNVSIAAKSLLLSNGGAISASTFGTGDAGNIAITVHDQVKISGLRSDVKFSSGISSNVGRAAKGKGGDINITSDSLFLLNGGDIGASIFGVGDAGNITITARDQVMIDGVIPDGEFSSGIFSNLSTGGKGKGGDITLITGSLGLSNGGLIAASTFGAGDGGKIKIVARDRIEIKGEKSEKPSGVYARVNDSATGRGGEIDVTTGSLFLSQGGLITASTFGLGDAGNIKILARDAILIDAQTGSRSGIYSAIDQSRARRIRGGNITLETGSLILENGGIVSTKSTRLGRAGDITIQARSKIEIIASSTNGDSEINLIASGRGASGNLSLQSPSLVLKDRGAIRAEANFSDPGGNITLSVDQLLMRRQAKISATGGVRSSGGNIEINAESIVAPLSENSDISANAFRGQGGNIRINADAIFGIKARPQLTPESDITASSAQGVQGTISLTQPDTSPEQGLIQLPGNPIDASNQIGQSCPNARNSRAIGKFIISGRGSLPPNPFDRIADHLNLPPLAQFPQDPPTQTTTVQSAPADIAIVEAQGWQKDAEGKVVLMAQMGRSVPTFSIVGSCPSNRVSSALQD